MDIWITKQIQVALDVYISLDSVYHLYSYSRYWILVLTLQTDVHIVSAKMFIMLQVCSGRDYCHPRGFWMWQNRDLSVLVQILQQ